jgi:predicted DNA-binding protein
MGFDLPDDIERRLRETAKKSGKTVDMVAAELISEQFERMDQERTEVINAIKLADKAIAESREKPLVEFVAEQRSKYGFPREWPNVISDKES